MSKMRVFASHPESINEDLSLPDGVEVMTTPTALRPLEELGFTELPGFAYPPLKWIGAIEDLEGAVDEISAQTEGDRVCLGLSGLDRGELQYAVDIADRSGADIDLVIELPQRQST